MYRPIVKSAIEKDITSDIIYYNIVMTGSPNQTFTNALYEETRTQPIIDDPSKYYLSVVRFSIDGSTIPLFVCPVIPNPGDLTDVNFTPFVVTLSYNGINYSTNVRYIPSSNAPIPLPPTATNQDIVSTYYYVYYYTTFIQMVNNAINTSFNALVLANPGLTIKAPYFQYNTDSEKISLVVPNIDNPLIPGTNVYLTQYNVNGIPAITPQPNGTVYMYMNNQLFSFFDGIEVFSYNGLSNLFIIRDLKNNYYYPPQIGTNTSINQTAISFTNDNINYTTRPEWFIFTQQYNMIFEWNSLSTIVFLTNSLPVNKEFIPSTTINSISTGTNSFRPVLTDFIPDLNKSGDSRSRFNYYPQGPYRLIELNSHEPLRKIDLRIYWEDHLQNLYPLFITYGECDTIKLMFMKKTLAKYNNQISY